MVATLTGQPNRIPLIAWVAAAALLFAGAARADEREDRDRKARAALALTASSAPKVATAPAPKAKSVAYADGYKRASAEQQPLVVYVGTPMEPVPGAVVSWAETFGDTKAPAVVVGYPVGDRLYVHATLPGAPSAEQVQREVKAAAKKADPKPMPPREVKDSPAPRPLDWQIRADELEDRPVRKYRLPAKLPEAQMTTMSRAEMDKWRAKAPASTVYTVVAGSVIDARTEPEEVLSPWALYVSTFADVGAAVERTKGTDLPPNVKPSIKIILNDRTEPVYLNGERFDPADCKWFPDGCDGESHHEFLRWYAYTGACKVEKRKGGGWNFTSLEGAERDAAYRAGGAEPDAPWILANYFKHEIRSLKECRAMWAKETPKEDREFVARQPARVQARRVVPNANRSDARTELDVLRDSFVRVRTEQFGGSGVVAWSEPGRSLVFTCWHVIESGGPIAVRTGGRTLPARIVEVDRAADLALLEVNRELPQVAAVEAEEPAEGDEVVMLGAASIWSRGKVLDTATANGKPSAQGDFEGYSGDSGGPVFRKGVLIGIARSVDDKGRARFSTRLDGMLVRGIKRDRAPVAAAPKVLPAVSAAPDCPTGKCPLQSPFAGPVVIQGSGGCASGQCDAPSYGRGGFFRRR